MYIFPIGTVVVLSNAGTLDDISYNMFEPNAGCNSYKKYDILQTIYQNKMMATRKKTEPTLQIEYGYLNIFDREYRQIEHFLETVDESLTSFYVVDFSRGQTPDSLSYVSNDWKIEIKDTRLYSTTTNYKACRAFVKKGSMWKEGSVIAITQNSSITVDINTYNYGALSITDAADGMVYPMYECHALPNSISNLKTTNYVQEPVNILSNGGWMRSGNVSFVSKYRV